MNFFLNNKKANPMNYIFNKCLRRLRLKTINNKYLVMNSNKRLQNQKKKMHYFDKIQNLLRMILKNLFINADNKKVIQENIRKNYINYKILMK